MGGTGSISEPAGEVEAEAEAEAEAAMAHGPRAKIVANEMED